MREGETSEEVSVVVFSSSPIQLFISKVNEMQKNLKKEEFLAKKNVHTLAYNLDNLDRNIGFASRGLENRE